MCGKCQHENVDFFRNENVGFYRPVFALPHQVVRNNPLFCKKDLQPLLHQEFVKSNQYRDMPTDEKLSKERIEETSEEQEEIGESAEQISVCDAQTMKYVI